MASFTAGTTFVDGVSNDVTAAKLGALITNATPTSGFIQDRTAETVVATNDTLLIGDASDSNTLKRMTVANIMKAELTGTINTTAGTIATLNSTTGTIATLNSTTPTFLGAITASTNTINVGSGQIYKDSSGNVGIGTSSPSNLLHVRKTSGGNTAQFEGAGVSDSYVNITNTGVSNLFLGFNNSGSTNSVGIATGVSYLANLNGYPIAFSTNATERLRIDSSGNVIVSGNKSLISNGAGGVALNTSIGSSALASNTTGYNNTASGVNALYSNTTGVNNTASGVQALYSNTTGYNNTANGLNALYYNTTGINNTANGVYALYSNTTGDQNTASGVYALYSNTTGYNNTASGFQALISNTTGYQNTASGLHALYSNTTGVNNTASGVQALFSNTTGDHNTANGYAALFSNTTGYQNTANGVNALYSNTTGYNNTASGFQAGYGTGLNSNTTGANNTFIGNGSVGASATTSNAITLGNGSIATLRCQVTSITALSDKRDKKDIENLSAGLEFIGKLRPVSFIWNTRDKAKVNIPDAGFIAQELLDVQEATGITIPNLVSQENPEKLEAAYATLIPVLVQAIKELKAKVESLEEKNK